MAPPRAAATRPAAGASALVLALLPLAAQARCSKLDESCLHTGCCSTPKSACYQKNKEAAFCRLGCEAGIHPDDPKEYRTAWSCTLLTFGCSPAWQPCEGAKGQNPDVVPCCQQGCMCNYTSKYFHQCVPPDGQTDCGPDGPEEIPDFARPKGERHSGSSSSGGDEEEEEEEEEEGSEKSDDGDDGDEAEETGGDCFKVGGVMMGPDCPQDKAEVITDARLQKAGWQPSRMALVFAGGSASACVVAAAAAMFLWRQSRTALYVRRDVELSLSEDELS